MFFWKMVLGVFIFLILNYVSPSDKGQCGRFQEGNCKTADPSQRMTDQHDGREFVPELSIPERVSTCYDSVHLASPENGPLVKMHSATVLKLVVPLLSVTFHACRCYPFLEHI